MMVIERKYMMLAYMALTGVAGLFLLAKFFQVPGLIEKIFVGIALFFGIFVFALAVLMRSHGYLVSPLITKFFGVRQVFGSFEIPPSYDCVVKKEGDLYYATNFLGLRIFESVEEKMAEEIIYTEYFERAVSSLKFVFKVCYMLVLKDISKYREDMEAKRLEAQLRLSRARSEPEPDALKIDRYERDMAKWETELAKITAGERPLGFTGYIMTTAIGVTEEAAMAKVKNQAKELKSTIATSLNVEVNSLSGAELKKAFEWEYFFPLEEKELRMEI